MTDTLSSKTSSCIKPNELPTYLPGKLLGTSDNLRWNGVEFRSYRYTGHDVELPSFYDYMLVSYSHGKTRMERRCDDGKWRKATCKPGVVSLLTRSQKSHWHWSEDIDVKHLYISPKFFLEIASDVMDHSVCDITLEDILRIEDPLVTSAINMIAQETKDKAIGGPLYVESIARQLIIHLLRKYASVRMRPFDKAGELSLKQMRAIEDYVDANISKNLDLKTIASQINLGTTSFMRYFKKTKGMTTYAFVLERRLLKAKSLLKFTNLPIKQVALASGFSDQAHLTRLFQRQYQSTPAIYRKEKSQKFKS